MAFKRRSSRSNPFSVYSKYIAQQARRTRNAERLQQFTDALPDAVKAITSARAVKNAENGGYQRWMGRGSYSLGKQYRKVAQSKFGRSLRRMGEGAALGYLTGGPTGAALGAAAGRGLYTGRGAYNANNLIQGGDGSMSFNGSFDETEGMTISDKEYVTDIYGPSSTGFNSQSFPLNPGISANFPKLAQFAQNFEEYEWIQLIYEFRSTIDATSASTTGQTGSIMMATNYNPAAQPYGDKEAVLQSHGGNSGRLTEDLAHGVECDPNKSVGDMEKFVRIGPIPSNEDIKSYDHGLFQVCINNCPSTFANQQVGELWCSYTVKLRKPRLFSARGHSIQKDLFLSGTGTETLTLPMGTQTALLKAQQNNIGCGIQLSTNVIKVVFPAQLTGAFRVRLRMESASAMTISNVLGNTTVSGQVTTVANLYSAGSDSSDSPSWQSGPGATTTLTAVYEFSVYLKAATGGFDNALTIGVSGTAFGTVNPSTSSCLEIMEDNPSFFANGVSVPAPVLVNNATGAVVSAL
jgi:hypothetical protein